MIRLEARNLAKKYGSQLLFKELTLEAESPTVLGIAGPNGSGKSTLLKCLTHLVKPTKGEVSWSHEPTSFSVTSLREHLGFAAPYLEYYAELTIRENLEFIAAHRDSSDSIEDLLTRFQLAKLGDQPYGNCSSGQRQRVKLAAALVAKPHIVILDEPGTNLDSSGHHLVAECVAENRRLERLTLLASNNADELDLCDRILNIEQFD